MCDMGVYTPLQTYLSQRTEDIVELSYEEIERILHRPLPPTAYGDNKRQWWANSTSVNQARAWLQAKRRVRLDPLHNTVAFIRDESLADVASEDEASLMGLLEPCARRLVQDVAEEQDISASDAIALMINQAARARRRDTLDWFAANTAPSAVSSAELIRADRDAR
ncbi:hypothetical protein ABIE19_001161 [Brevundimonas faecalis]|uniref:DUF7662 domain-containing protein n=2 Tax=Brevundimonas faecalis TaxID=947378 RepID=A0ABV2R9K6_9CAUL